MSENHKPLVVITGASSGIGAATAKLFSENGHPLLLLARRVDRLDALGLPNVICAQVDVTDRDAVKEAVKDAEEQFGPVDCMVNNAGVMLLGFLADQSPDEWDKMLSVNVMGVLNGVNAVLKPMVQRQGGTIINVSSVAGRKTFPNHVVYCGTKFAVHAITENLREEIAASNVRLTTIAPGAVETELLSHTTDENIKSGYEDWKTAMDGIISAEDVARSVYFAYSQPQSVCIREIVLAKTTQQP
ncbi:putative oxidoreductase [Poriferisphaera corsica]|uniref:Putative oxidoreductase n=1 Tax=Poriferisphaera corsica TaxID=2528020 RepID=A0A517YYI6_9BACT|nr:SDR family oxidoreductase [Poriferisphaera corsica]QDU35283.1 putative oxidoreductase [Poriferisphaera corsica]